MDVLFADAQRTAAAHKKALAGLQRLLDKGDHVRTFLECVDRILLVWKNDPAMPRLIQFISAACTTGSTSNVLLTPTIEHLTSRMDCKDKAARLRSVQILRALLASLPADFDLAEATWTALQSRLIARAKDKLAPIRAAACSALKYLQESESLESCAAAGQLRWSGAQDSSGSVRAAATAAVLLAADTLPLLLQRVADTDAEVRVAALTRLRLDVEVAHLTAAARRRVLAAAVTDAAAEVRQAGVLLAAAWLAACGWDMLGLLEQLDFISCYAGDDSSSGSGSGSGGLGGGSTAPALAAGVPNAAVTAAERTAEAVLYALFAFVERPQPKEKKGGAAASASAGGLALSSVAEGGEGEEEEEEAADAAAAAAKAATRALTPAQLWKGALDCILALVPNPADCTPEMALYWRARAAWVTGSPHMTAGPAPLAIASSISADKRADILDALLPDVPTLYGLISNVALDLGVRVEVPGHGALAGLSLQHMALALQPADDEEEEQELPQPARMLRVIALANGVPVPSRLAAITAITAGADTAAACTLRQLLILAQAADYSDETGRRYAISTLMQLLPHPSLPAWCVPLLARALASACGCGLPADAYGPEHATANRLAGGSTEGFREMTSLLVAAITSLRAASVAAAAAGGHGSAGSGSGGAGGGTSHAAALHAQAEQLRQQLEDAQDAVDSARDKKAARAAVASLQSALDAVEAELSELGGAEGGLGGSDLHHTGDNARPVEPQELASLLRYRALQLLEALLAGVTVPQPLQAAALLPSVTQAAFAALQPRAEPAAASPHAASSLLYSALIAEAAKGADGVLAAAAWRCGTLLCLCQPSPAAAAAVAAPLLSLLHAAAVDTTLPYVQRHAAVTCLADMSAALGIGAGSGTASLSGVSVPETMLLLIDPSALLRGAAASSSSSSSTTSSSNSGEGVALAVAAGRCLVQLVLTGALSPHISPALHAFSSLALPAAAAPTDAAAATATATGPTRCVAVLQRLFELHLALLWLQASAEAAADNAEEDEQRLDDAEDDGTAGGAGAGAGADLAAVVGGAAAERLAELSAAAAAFGRALPALACLSPQHKAASLHAALLGVRRMMLVGMQLGFTGSAGGPGASAFAGAAAAAFGAAPGGAAAAAADEDGDAAEEKKQDEEDEPAPKPKAPKKLVAPAKGAKAGAKGGAGAGAAAAAAADSDGDDAASTISAAVGGPGGKGSITLSSGAGWIGAGLAIVARVALADPSATTDAAAASATAATATAASDIIPADGLPSWAVASGTTTVRAAELAAACLLADAAADVSLSGGGGVYLPVLLAALKSLPVNVNAATAPSPLVHAMVAACEALVKGCVVFLRSAAAEKSSRKLMAAWALPPPPLPPAAAAVGDAMRGIVTARTAAVKACAPAGGAGSGKDSSEAGGGAGAGGSRTRAAPVRASAAASRARAAAAAADSDGEEEDEEAGDDDDE